MLILKYFLWSALAFLCVFIYYSSKIQDKYGISMIVGQIGVGKSSIICSLIRKYLKQGWNVYADFVTNIPGCRYFDARNLDAYIPEENSVLFLDEASLVFFSRDFKDFKKYTAYMALCRHFKNKIYMSSQSFDVDLYIRNRVSNMYLVKRIGCISIMRKIKKLQTVLSAETLSNSQDMKNSGLVDGYKYCSIFEKDGIHLFWLPALWKWHDSFYKEGRPYIKYSVPVPFEEKGNSSFLKSIISRFSIKGDRREALDLENQGITSASYTSMETVYDIGAEGDMVSETRMELLDD